MKMRYCIWGCGNRGKNIYNFMRGKDIYAFIDSNPELQGASCQGVPILSFDQYRNEYGDCIIVISTFHQDEIVEKLEEMGIPFFSSWQMPPEIVEAEYPNLYSLVEKKVCSAGTIYLYGLNLYSLLLFEYFTQRGRTVKIIPGEKELPMRAKLAETEGEGCFSSLNEMGNAPLYVTSNEHALLELPERTLRNLYDFTGDIEANHKPYLEKYKDLYSGRRCFVVGTGPSLRIEDLDKMMLNGDICISVNGIIQAFSLTKWRPDFYMLIDRIGYAAWETDLLGKYRMEHTLLSDTIEGTENKGFEIFHLSRLMAGPPPFAKDFSRGCYTSCNVVYCALQFAAYLGCSQIYLYGVDFDYGNGNNHFSPDYYASFKRAPEASATVARVYDFALSQSYQGYLSARKAAEERGFKIYNASRRTKLDVFKRVDFDSLFDGGPARFL